MSPQGIQNHITNTVNEVLSGKTIKQAAHLEPRSQEKYEGTQQELSNQKGRPGALPEISVSF